MGYTLKIGEAIISWHHDLVKIDCKNIELPDSPAFGEPTDRTNSRWPSYSSWANAMKKLGLMDIMFNERNGGKGYVDWKGKVLYPLLQEHPGASPITPDHVDYIECKLTEYKAKFSDHIAKYPPPKEGAKPLWEGSSLYQDSDLVDDPRFDGDLCRGEWLLWWCKWAVENCKHPVFVNS